MKRTHVLSAIYAIGLIGIAAAAVFPGRAHPPSIVNAAAEKAVGEEIQAFRKQLADAIKAKDAPKLRGFYAPSFAHTHTTGKTDNRDARIGAHPADIILKCGRQKVAYHDHGGAAHFA